jgi:hypothetical protein
MAASNIRGREFMKTRLDTVISVLLLLILMSGAVAAQTAYQPKFPGDPARSDSEAAALGYMRTVLRAQKLYKRKNQNYATSLAQLVHTGSFTKRMVNSDRGDYTVGFRAKKDKDTFELAMTPKQLDAEHRSFYAKEDGRIHVEEQGPASENSPILK